MEKRKEYLKNYYAKPEVKKRLNKYKKEWKQKNPEKYEIYWKKHNLNRKENGYLVKYYQENKEKILKQQSDWYKTPKGKYLRYIKNCRQKKREFSLSEVEFCSIIKQPCYYCGSIEKVGVDRIDSKIGYVEGNCLPCCWNCNHLKNDLPIEVFYSQVKKIYSNLKLGEKNET